jgi:hypothetical protein
MWHWFVSRRRKKAFRVSLQSRVVIFVTLLLTVAATPLFAMFEWNNCLQSCLIGDKIAKLCLHERHAANGRIQFDRLR